MSRYPDLSLINSYRFRFGIAKLEELAGREEMQNLADDSLIKLLRDGMKVDVTHFSFSPVEVRGIISTVRNLLAEKLSDKLTDL